VAVASTKSYVAQVAFLAMLTGALDHKPNVITHLYALTDAIKDVIARKKEIQVLADSVADAKDAFYVGRGEDYLAGMEGALKLKEVAYVHAECYPGGELKARSDCPHRKWDLGDFAHLGSCDGFRHAE
jgi:glucosamine--fructose-6-phosphate aminotransferase (isomerizing)